MVLVHHHIKYKEIHGIDEVVLMEKSEHTKLHARLRKENRCNVPVKELHRISGLANDRRGDYSRQTRYYHNHPESNEKKILSMRIYNTYHGGYSIVPRIRPDIISSAMTPTLRTGRA